MFGVCASSFAANMAFRQNALDHREEHPETVNAFLEVFYVDDGLVGADSVHCTIKLESYNAFFGWEALSSGNGKPAIG